MRDAAGSNGHRRAVVAVVVVAAIGLVGALAAMRSVSAVPATTSAVFKPPVFVGEAAVVENAFRTNLEAYDAKDADAVLARLSKAARANKHASRPELVAFMTDYRVVLLRIDSILVKGTTATIDYEDAIVGRTAKPGVTTAIGQRDVWVKEGADWNWASNANTTARIPSGVARVAVTMRDDDPLTVKVPLPKGEFALVLTNAGKATKGIFILGISTDLDVKTFLARQMVAQTPRLPDGVVEMGAAPDIPAGGSGTMVFSGVLPKGRYLLVARRGEKAGEHPILPNEYAEFTVA